MRPSVAKNFAAPRKREGAGRREAPLLRPHLAARAPFAQGASPLGAPPRRFQSSGPRFLNPAFALRPMQRAPRGGVVMPPIGSRGLPSAGLRAPPAGAAPRSAFRIVSRRRPSTRARWQEYKHRNIVRSRGKIEGVIPGPVEGRSPESRCGCTVCVPGFRVRSPSGRALRRPVGSRPGMTSRCHGQASRVTHV
jgi:hypothetical protein